MNLPSTNIAVVIVNYNTAELTIEATYSVLRNTDSKDVVVVVVDNGSRPDSRKALVSEFDQLENVYLIESKTNGGFSSGNNIGISSIDANYYVLLNSDAQFLSKDTLPLLMSHFEEKETGLVGPRLVDQEGTHYVSRFRNHSWKTELISAAKTSLIDRLLGNKTIAITDNDTPPEWLSFAFVVIRKEVFEDIGLLDENFFLYFEDADFCFRSQKNGWSLVYCDRVTGLHKRGKSSNLKTKQANLSRLPKYFYYSRTRYFLQNYSKPYLIIANIAWHTGALISWLRRLTMNSNHKQNKRMWRDIWTFSNPNNRG